MQDGVLGFHLRDGLPCVETEEGSLVYSVPAKKLALLRPGQRVPPALLAPARQPEALDRGRKKTIAFIATADCLQRCVYCFNRGGEGRERLDPDMALAILRSYVADSPGCLSVRFFGGEPTLNFRLIHEVVAFVESCTFERALSITTGGHVPVETLDWLLEHGFSFAVSMDGPEDVQAELRPLVRASQRLLAPWQTVRRITDAGASLRVRMTVTERNVDRICEAVRYFGDLGAKIVHVEPVTYKGRATSGIGRPAAETFAERLLEAIDVAASRGMRVVNSAYMNLLEDRTYCPGGPDHIVVGLSGEILRCYETGGACDAGASGMLLGQYDRSSGRIEYAPPVVSGCGNGCRPRECSECGALSVCGGGCPSRDLADTGVPSAPGGYFCRITRILVPRVLLRLAASGGLVKQHSNKGADP